MKRSVRAIGLVSIVALGLGACASKPSGESSASGGETGASSAASSSTDGSANGSQAATSAASNAKVDPANFTSCMVSDSGGWDDRSFNATSLKGMKDAAKQFGIKTKQIESKTDNDYTTNINAMVQAKCNIIVGVGFKLEGAIDTAAKANPGVKFAIVDSSPKTPITNVKPLLFNTAQAAFMSGYLAAGMTKSGIVGTFGGDKIPSVTIFMDGFNQGVEYYNKQKSKTVKVVGWDEKGQKGLFAGSFTDSSKGKTLAGNLITQGADVILPVAGGTGNGALLAAKASGGKVTAIWVDTDGCVSNASFCGSLLSSVEKGMDLAVKNAISDALNNKFSNTPYVGTLKNNGVSLAPYHQFDSKIPADLKKEIDKIKTDIIAGTIKITSKAQPTS